MNKDVMKNKRCTNYNNNTDIVSFGRKKTIKGIILGTILGGILFGGIGVAAVTLTADQVKYTASNEKFTVSNVKDALDEIYKISAYEIPVDTYFYESGTEGAESTIVRYKKVDGKYYVCDVNGDVAQGTVATDVTSKTLIPYTSMSAENVSAGSSGYASNSFILGNGFDNAEHFDQGENASSNAITIGSYDTITTQQINCTHIPNYDKLTIDNFVYDDVSIRHGAYLQWSAVNVADSYNPTTGIYTIGQKTNQITGANPYYNSFAINFTLKYIP